MYDFVDQVRKLTRVGYRAATVIWLVHCVLNQLIANSYFYL